MNSNVIGRLQDGDLCLFIQSGIFDRIIAWYTNGPYSHVGVVRFRDNVPYLVEARFELGVVETPLQDYLEDGSITLVFVRILNGNTLLSKEDGKTFADACYRVLGANYDALGILGFIRIVTHKIFKIIPMQNPWDNTGKYWCSELVREQFYSALGWDFMEDISKGFESPNDIVKPKPDGTMRVTTI